MKNNLEIFIVGFLGVVYLDLYQCLKNMIRVIIDNIFHDKTTEMELHPYFNTNAIKQIRMKQLLEEDKRIFFKTNEIEFIDSDHHNGDTMNSQFIQFVDIILNTTIKCYS